VVLIFFNSKAQIGFVKIFFLVLTFVLMWAFWLGKWLNEWVALSIENTPSMSGLEVFLLANINMWILLLLFIGILIYVYSGGAQR
jgi:hypothetical protein